MPRDRRAIKNSLEYAHMRTALDSSQVLSLCYRPVNSISDVNEKYSLERYIDRSISLWLYISGGIARFALLWYYSLFGYLLKKLARKIAAKFLTHTDTLAHHSTPRPPAIDFIFNIFSFYLAWAEPFFQPAGNRNGRRPQNSSGVDRKTDGFLTDLAWQADNF